MSMMYLALGLRPDISFAISKLSGFLDCYGTVHWQATIRVLRYLKGTRTMSLTLGASAFRHFSCHLIGLERTFPLDSKKSEKL
jgi:hypothetical protein